MRNMFNCPVCEGSMKISQVYCDQCGTSVSGQFGLPANYFSKLNETQINFVLNFLKCEGKFNRLAEELNLSYPTLKNRLNEILTLLGLESEKQEEPGDLSSSDRIAILKQLDQGKITIEEAEKILSRNGL